MDLEQLACVVLDREVGRSLQGIAPDSYINVNQTRRKFDETLKKLRADSRQLREGVNTRNARQ